MSENLVKVIGALTSQEKDELIKILNSNTGKTLDFHLGTLPFCDVDYAIDSINWYQSYQSHHYLSYWDDLRIGNIKNKLTTYDSSAWTGRKP